MAQGPAPITITVMKSFPAMHSVTGTWQWILHQVCQKVFRKTDTIILVVCQVPEPHMWLVQEEQVLQVQAEPFHSRLSPEPFSS